jgi:hypothetical protein
VPDTTGASIHNDLLAERRAARPTAVPELPDNPDFRLYLTDLAERVNGFVYAGDRLNAVIDTVRALRADPKLLAELIGGCHDWTYSVRYDTDRNTGTISNPEMTSMIDVERRFRAVTRHPACRNAEVVRRPSILWVGDWETAPDQPPPRRPGRYCSRCDRSGGELTENGCPTHGSRFLEEA